MVSITARMSGKHQVVIPKAVREALELEGQDEVLFVIDGETVLLMPRPASFTEALRGLHQEIWPEPDEWLEEERSSWEGR
jgi:AbrB family looped-hinge helix DNA binding protein